MYVPLLIRDYRKRHPEASEVTARRDIEHALALEVGEQTRDRDRHPSSGRFERNLWMLALLFVVDRNERIDRAWSTWHVTI